MDEKNRFEEAFLNEIVTARTKLSRGFRKVRLDDLDELKVMDLRQIRLFGSSVNLRKVNLTPNSYLLGLPHVDFMKGPIWDKIKARELYDNHPVAH